MVTKYKKDFGKNLTKHKSSVLVGRNLPFKNDVLKSILKS